MKFNKKNILAYFDKQSFAHMIMGSIISIAVLLILVVGHYWASYENMKYNNEYNTIKTELEENQKRLVSREVQRTLNYISYVRSLSKETMKSSLSNRVEVAHDIASNIYNENKGKLSDKEIKSLIKDALRPFRMSGPDDYVFIYSLDGDAVLLPKSRKYEGLSGLNLRDERGNYFIHREVHLMKDVDVGFIYYNDYNENRGDSSLYKVSYIKKFIPYNWYIGSKLYLSDHEAKLKKDVINRISNIRFDSDGYVFIQQFNNVPILSQPTLTNKDTLINESELTERQKITEIARKGGGFVEYHFKRPGRSEKEIKVSYVVQIPEWEWVIGAGYYTKDIDLVVAQKSKEIKSQRIKTITIITLALIAILLIGIALAKVVANQLKTGLSRIDKFFKSASTNYIVGNEDTLITPELISLGKSANKMVTDLKSIKVAFEKEHSLLRSIINSIPDMVFFKDLNSRYIGGNEAFLKYIGLNEIELIGKTDFEIFPLEAAKIYYENDLKILKDGIPIRNEEWVVMPNGKKLLFDTLKVLCHDSSNNITGIICISRDITEKEIIQKKYIEAKEKAEESDRLKTAFLANMSHEIRTPMNSIIGFSNLIAEGGLSEEEQSEYVEHIDTAINNLLNLINDIIDIAKIEAGQLTIKPEFFTLSKLLEEQHISALEYRRKAEKENVTITYTLDDKLQKIKILSDPYRLNQVITNLVVNAIKFTKEGKIIFGCNLIEDRLYFYVEDTGIGISEKDIESLFTRFKQVGENKGYHAGGTGLGLAISKHIIDLMKGEIGVKSEKGTGSLFYFYIPYYPLENEVDHRKLTSKVNWSNKTVLIVENEEPSFNYLKAVFSVTGAKILRAMNFIEATNIYKNNDRIDLFYCDVSKEDKALRSFYKVVNQSIPRPPFIGQLDSINDAPSDLEFDSIIIKPVKYHLLIKTISQFIRLEEKIGE